MNESIEKLKKSLPYLLCAFEDARQTGKPVITIASQQPDGSGKMLAVINEPEEFLSDIAKIAGIENPPTKKQMLEYKAESFLQKWKL